MKDKKKVFLILIIFTIIFILIQGHLSYFRPNSFSHYIAQKVYNLIMIIRGHSERSVNEIELICRKYAHLVMYFILGTVVFIGTRLYIVNKFIGFIVTFIICLPIPLIDEFIIQRMSQGRGAHLLDVFLDVFGITFAVSIGLIYTFMFDCVEKKNVN